MAGSFQRWMQSLQSFFLGEDENDYIEEKNEKPTSEPNQKGRVKQPPLTPINMTDKKINQAEPVEPFKREKKKEQRVLHHYPQKGQFRFPLSLDETEADVEQQEPGEQEANSAARQRRQNIYDIPAFERNKKDRPAFVPKTEKRPSQRTEKRPAEPYQKPKRPEKRMDPVHEPAASDKTESGYFQGRDFKARHIPSPVFGYENFPLHRDSLKKKPEYKQTDIPKADEQKNREYQQKQTEAPPSFEQKELKKKAYLYPEEQEKQPSNPPAGEKIDIPKPNEKRKIEARRAPVIEVKDEINEQTGRKEESKVRTLSFEETRSQEKPSSTATETRPETASEETREKNPYNVMMPAKRRLNSQPAGRKNKGGYIYPSLSLLNPPLRVSNDDEASLAAQQEQLEAALRNFNVKAVVSEVTKGPSVTRFEVQPAPGVKVNKITNLTDDIKLAMAAKDLRMEAPIPGKNAIGIEVPNAESQPVFLREILRRDVFIRSESPLTVALGLDISGAPITADLQTMPHGLIAGATGSGKSVCINSILISLLYKASPEDLKLMLIDPKMVELAAYKDIPHLVTPVIHDAKEATAGLKWAVQEMEDRYRKLAHEGVRDSRKYNEKMQKQGNYASKMPYIVIVIDELADLMMVSPQEVEDSVCRIAQKARACGIHLLLATQRPSVDVITGLIKSNIPSRTAFAVSSQIDSRTILDMGGAERLIGKGDMLFYPNGAPKPIRVQGTFVTDEEIEAVTDFVKNQSKPDYFIEQDELIKQTEAVEVQDDLFEEACVFVSEHRGASSSLLQRKFSIGYNRAAKLIDLMEAKGFVSEAMGSKPRKVLVSPRELEDMSHS
ncbi:S-DNA-T family DNA segregation ATPase FtsK/SpoIIIE [Sinobaca qinghaiensis]|uniref:S-DNA-T family DNA segregation ATPase FtsK/SpoIIIE n=1 Tax=Sinobaca qinghaiensis TaxID=342944 RepID=A0A419UVY4_9BACL|nr:DNA translocase FtsK [Sinobaca qinghaiensis]RKD68756.1 S-DNA-T family DNA segregation ATPase FtsK/SpoIIIE [Sinobaca qinghaiensis]